MMTSVAGGLMLRIGEQIKLSVFETPVGKVRDPIPQIHINPALGQGTMHRQMPMTKDQVIVRGKTVPMPPLLLTQAVLVQPFLVRVEGQLPCGCCMTAGFLGKSAAFGEMLGQGKGNIRMQPSKHALAQGGVENSPKSFEAVIARAFAIPVGQIEVTAFPFNLQGIAMKDHPQFLFQIPKGPQIVVPRKIMNRNPPIG